MKLPLQIPNDWTIEQAMTVLDFLAYLTECIECSYGQEIADACRPDSLPGGPCGADGPGNKDDISF